MPTSSRTAAFRGGDAPLQRRWRIPPPYLRGSEAIEGSTILEEVPGALGILLWQCVRDVTLWALTPREEREGLFTEDAERRRLASLLSVESSTRHIEPPLRATAAMLSHPADTSPEAMMLACQRISQWAEVEGASGTALTFAQAAALAMPASAKSALRVGRLARQRGEYPRAEGWLQRSIMLARQSRERETHAGGYAALGNLFRLRGNLPAAQRSHLRALRLARRHSLLSREAAALHDLFALSVETGHHDAATRYAQEAVAAYGPKHPSLPTLAHDIAVLWIEQGRPARAVPVLRATWPRMERYQRLLGLSNLARATGGAGDRPGFESCWARAASALSGTPATEQLATIVLNLARGAASIEEWKRGGEMAGRALELAEAFGETKTLFEAEALLQAIRSEQRLALPFATIEPEVDEIADFLAGELTTSLSVVGAA